MELQPELMQEIGARLIDDAPDGWARIEVKVTAAGERADISMVVTMPDGTVVPVRMAVPQTAAAIMRLRTEVYQEDIGTWYNAVIVIDEDQRMQIQYDYDNPPFGPYDVTAANIADQIAELFDDLLEDHRALPRLPWNLPDWHPASITDPARLGGAVEGVMVAAAPAGWTRLHVRYEAAADVIVTTFSITMSDGTVLQRLSLPGLGDDVIAASRRAYHQRENRLWYRASFDLENGADLRVDYEQREPFGGVYDPDGWGDGGADPELLRRDHEMFPVPLDQLPYWHPAKSRDFALDRDLLDQLRGALLAASPGPWYRLILDVRAVADVIKTRLVTKIDRWDYDISAELDEHGIQLMQAIRASAYRTRPAKGAWYAAQFALANPRMIAATLDYDAPPSWDFPDLPQEDSPATSEDVAPTPDVDADLVRRDHEMYPRDPNHLPE
ncbi:hypothetical protein [Jiangella sp. DSM 45060]|uniref:hypothetical protein n=1 Tax=Jiangella sp. DSM 45060 TaxID=1798224 RepID=UPI00087A2EA8|nr:hypothetical protein [Jiangella sp. DSM 45060]SDT36932.1 hypothetical protein SAMN04515669_3749 [Jiangella sp. DSM 45060]